MDVLGLFPTPVSISKLERNLSSNELSFIKDNELKIRPNNGNFTSTDHEILEKTEMTELKFFILQEVKKYFNNVICPDNSVEPYITLSWLNFTYKNGHHHRHSHNNSIISGVFYIQVANDDKIWFYNEKHKSIDITTKEFNIFNSSSWWVPAEANNLLLFPSELMHGVNEITSEESRISLSFNVFVKGNLGSKAELKWLALN
jgi:uncharacterized protein (TIGR02466 family)